MRIYRGKPKKKATTEFSGGFTITHTLSYCSEQKEVLISFNPDKTEKPNE